MAQYISNMQAIFTIFIFHIKQSFLPSSSSLSIITLISLLHTSAEVWKEKQKLLSIRRWCYVHWLDAVWRGGSSSTPNEDVIWFWNVCCVPRIFRTPSTTYGQHYAGCVPIQFWRPFAVRTFIRRIIQYWKFRQNFYSFSTPKLRAWHNRYIQIPSHWKWPQ